MNSLDFPMKDLSQLTEEVFTEAVTKHMNGDLNNIGMKKYFVIYKSGEAFVMINNRTDEDMMPSMYISIYDRAGESLFCGTIRKHTYDDVLKMLYGIIQTYADQIR